MRVADHHSIDPSLFKKTNRSRLVFFRPFPQWWRGLGLGWVGRHHPGQTGFGRFSGSLFVTESAFMLATPAEAEPLNTS
jgi:hypothetical protein